MRRLVAAVLSLKRTQDARADVGRRMLRLRRNRDAIERGMDPNRLAEAFGERVDPHAEKRMEKALKDAGQGGLGQDERERIVKGVAE